MFEYRAYVGLDVHKETIATAVAWPGQVQAIAWAAQKRLCGRYAKLHMRGKAKNKVVTAVARELVGFIWAIACEGGGKPHGTRAVA